jgi:hypothetical protein
MNIWLRATGLTSVNACIRHARCAFDHRRSATLCIRLAWRPNGAFLWRGPLQAARLQAIQELAPADETIPSISTEALQRVAFLQIALDAVREELAAHTVHVGGGSEQPLD